MDTGTSDIQSDLQDQQQRLERERKAREKSLQQRRLKGLKSSGFGTPSLFEAFSDSGFTGTGRTLG